MREDTLMDSIEVKEEFWLSAAILSGASGNSCRERAGPATGVSGADKRRYAALPHSITLTVHIVKSDRGNVKSQQIYQEKKDDDNVFFFFCLFPRSAAGIRGTYMCYHDREDDDECAVASV
ncbi:hypothetical protein F2P81_018866 [Scophthalmus maximus]|uniref:Uncharacterized protein n=1 Tax=Scophthalmus maximus TaxID=52904 RepID=A0A6A4SF32_SCOMX|nr:hypothetical protein F2P81_018866 [Scophthalmus maximus]